MRVNTWYYWEESSFTQTKGLLGSNENYNWNNFLTIWLHVLAFSSLNWINLTSYLFCVQETLKSCAYSIIFISIHLNLFIKNIKSGWSYIAHFPTTLNDFQWLYNNILDATWHELVQLVLINYSTLRHIQAMVIITKWVCFLSSAAASCTNSLKQNNNNKNKKKTAQLTWAEQEIVCVWLRLCVWSVCASADCRVVME